MCGVIGLFLCNDKKYVSNELYEGAIFLQHRGQDSTGIACGDRGDKKCVYKNKGLLRDVFNQKILDDMEGDMGIIHLRYPTSGSNHDGETQPFYVNSPYGVWMAHNGNLVNTEELRDKVIKVESRHLETESDTEMLINIFASELERLRKQGLKVSTIIKALEETMKQIRGGYSCVCMVGSDYIIGFRDPNGIKPLVYGERTGSHGGVDRMIASESVALEATGYKNIHNVRPGEAVIFSRKQNLSNLVTAQIIEGHRFTPDIFEYIYFARSDSILDDVSVYSSRQKMGIMLAKKIKKYEDLNIDIVVAVPETSRISALECANHLRLPYREGFVKNSYIGRTFIMPLHNERHSSVKRKLHPIKHVFMNKNVLLVDDSIVRGTTSREIIKMARDAGALRVYMASCAPPIKHLHIYGIDLADRSDLIANEKNDSEIARSINADLVIFQDLDDLLLCCLGGLPREFEVGVFNNNYVTGPEKSYFDCLEKKKLDVLNSKKSAVVRGHSCYTSSLSSQNSSDLNSKLCNFKNYI